MSLRVNQSAVLALILSLSLPLVAAPRKWTTVTPKGVQPTVIESSKTKQDYFALTQKAPITVKVIGPGFIRIVSRTVLPGKKREGIYGLVVLKDGEDRKLFSRTTMHSAMKVVGAPNVRVGKPKTVTLKVPAGEHEYQVALPPDAKHDAFIRFKFSEKEAKKSSGTKVEYVAYLPRKFPEEVRIQVKEQENICYRATTEKPVEVEIIGPTKVKIISRLEFDHTMRGEKPYRVQVSEDSKIVQTSPFNGKISGTAAYSVTSDKIIGRGDTFFLDVPAGKHRYLVNTPDKGNSILLRFYLPQKDLGNEWKPAKGNGNASVVPKRIKPDKG